MDVHSAHFCETSHPSVTWSKAETAHACRGFVAPNAGKQNSSESCFPSFASMCASYDDRSNHTLAVCATRSGGLLPVPRVVVLRNASCLVRNPASVDEAEVVNDQIEAAVIAGSANGLELELEHVCGFSWEFLDVAARDVLAVPVLTLEWTKHEIRTRGCGGGRRLEVNLH